MKIQVSQTIKVWKSQRSKYIFLFYLVWICFGFDITLIGIWFRSFQNNCLFAFSITYQVTDSAHRWLVSYAGCTRAGQLSAIINSWQDKTLNSIMHLYIIIYCSVYFKYHAGNDYGSHACMNLQLPPTKAIIVMTFANFFFLRRFWPIIHLIGLFFSNISNGDVSPWSEHFPYLEKLSDWGAINKLRIMNIQHTLKKRKEKRPIFIAKPSYGAISMPKFQKWYQN